MTERVVQEFDEFTARLEATETVDVRARVAGTLERVHFREGQPVKRGELLFSLDGRAFEAELARAEASLAASSVQLDLAKSEVARAEKLLPAQAVSLQAVEQLRAAVRSSEAQVKAGQAGGFKIQAQDRSGQGEQALPRELTDLRAQHILTYVLL